MVVTRPVWARERRHHSRYGEGMSEILDVDLLAFERGTAAQRRAVVDGVRRSLVKIGRAHV